MKIAYTKSEKYILYRDSSRVGWKKLGELSSTNHGDLAVKLYLPKSTFSEDHILAPRGWCVSKFLHALENDQVLLAHPQGNGGPPYNLFQRKGQKLA